MSQPYPSRPDLLNLVRREITLQAIGSVAAELGEDTERTASAVSMGVPSVLTLLSEVASSPNGAAHLEAAIVAKSPEAAAREPVLLDGSAGARAAGFLDRELGSRTWDVSDEMSRASGIRRESAHTLLGGVASVTLLAMARNLDSMSSGALRSLLVSQRDEWRSGETPERVAPSYVADEGAMRVTTDRVYSTPAILPEPRRRRWLPPMLLVLAAIVAIPIILTSGRRHHQQKLQAISEEMSTRAPAPAAAPGSTAPGAAPQNAPQSAAPTRPGDLETFLTSGAGTLPQRFPMLLKFDTGATLPTAASTATLDEVAATLRAHPSAQIRLESTADDADTNTEAGKALAQSRSDAVKGLLVGRAIDGDRITAAVMSPRTPQTDTNTNARVELVVTSR